jgi:citrate lyase gamma subunit
VSLSDFAGKYVVLEWFNPECPFVRKHYDGKNMQALQTEYTAKGVIWLSINSSAEGQQGNYAPEKLYEIMKEKGAESSHVLLDEDGAVGHLYEAKTTPHMYIVDPSGKLIYQGAIDDTPSPHSDDIATSKNYVRLVLDAVLDNKEIPISATISYGCTVKYK